MARRNDPRKRRIVLGVLLLAYAVAAFVLLLVLAPRSDDPGRVGQILGAIGAGFGGVGLLLLVLGLRTPRSPSVDE